MHDEPNLEETTNESHFSIALDVVTNRTNIVNALVRGAAVGFVYQRLDEIVSGPAETLLPMGTAAVLFFLIHDKATTTIKASIEEVSRAITNDITYAVMHFATMSAAYYTTEGFLS